MSKIRTSESPDFGWNLVTIGTHFCQIFFEKKCVRISHGHADGGPLVLVFWPWTCFYWYFLQFQTQFWVRRVDGVSRIQNRFHSGNHSNENTDLKGSRTAAKYCFFDCTTQYMKEYLQAHRQQPPFFYYLNSTPLSQFFKLIRVIWQSFWNL